MDESITFERLEVANAQIDVWIDEEKYENVIGSYQIEQELKTDFKSAFSHKTCTHGKDSQWVSILNDNNNPVLEIRNIPEKGEKIDLRPHDYKPWSFFFWAKLIRAKIQQKGTDCYYRRLDEVVAYLERHRPPIIPIKQLKSDDQESHVLSNMLVVIYLLEMAASGEGGVDHRSFAERARRLIRDRFNSTPFYDFYDLLAQYNIGVGYFHERRYRKAVLEFNWIISKLRSIWDDEGNFNPCSGTSGWFVLKRLGRELLYLPAVLYRAEIQLNLQLAYHAEDTLSRYLKAPSDYKKARGNLIKAEAYQQMGRRDRAWQALCQASLEDLDSREYVKSFIAKPGGKLAKLRGRLQNLVIAEHLENLKERWPSMPVKALKEYLQRLNQFFKDCKLSTKHQKSNRIGYFKQIAEYIALVCEEANHNSKDLKVNKAVLKSKVEEIFEKNKEDILVPEKDAWPCPCKEKGVDLRRLDSKDYDAFSKNIRAFFQEMRAKSASTDKKQFLDRLKKLEENVRNNLVWRIRDLELDAMESPPRKWWCLERLPNRDNAFCGLLECVGKSLEENDDDLLARDYEKIMDHWDDHFLEHMRDVSFHKPSRCRAIHFLGLQRWNSTSPAQGRSLGGGYLIYHTNNGRVELGVAVDPGFDFVRNLFHIGYSLSDIDVVLLSHAHVDHVRDFESMISLLLELHKRTNKKIKRKLHTIMTLGVYRRLEYLIESPGLREFVEAYIVDIEKEIDQEFLRNCNFEFVQDPSEVQNDGILRPRFMPVLPDRKPNGELRLEITPTKAYHNDYSEYSDSFGFVIKIVDPKSEPIIEYTLGYTGDTSWNDDIMKQYRDKSCDALLVHLGSLIDREKQERKKFQHYKSHKECFKLIREKNHPYLMGMLHFLAEIDGWKHRGKKPLVLMSEFGEEMRGKIRLDFIKRLKKAYPDTFNVLPVDIGLDVLLDEGKSEECEHSRPLLEEGMPKVWCVRCKDFVSLEQAAFEHYGHDEALFCVCRTCQKATPPDVLQERLRALYEIGRRLETGRQK